MLGENRRGEERGREGGEGEGEIGEGRRREGKIGEGRRREGGEDRGGKENGHLLHPKPVLLTQLFHILGRRIYSSRH